MAIMVYLVHLPESCVCSAVKEFDKTWSWTEVIFWLQFVQSAIGFMDMRQSKEPAQLKQYTAFEKIAADVFTLMPIANAVQGFMNTRSWGGGRTN